MSFRRDKTEFTQCRLRNHVLFVELSGVQMKDPETISSL